MRGIEERLDRCMPIAQYVASCKLDLVDRPEI